MSSTSRNASRGSRGRGRATPSRPSAPSPFSLLALADSRLPTPFRSEPWKPPPQATWDMLVADYKADPTLSAAKATLRYGLTYKYVVKRLRSEGVFRLPLGSNLSPCRFFTIVCGRCQVPFTITTAGRGMTFCPPCAELHAADVAARSAARREAIRLACTKMREQYGWSNYRMAQELGMKKAHLETMLARIPNVLPAKIAKKQRAEYDEWMRWRQEEGCTWNEVAKRAGYRERRTVMNKLRGAGYDVTVPACIKTRTPTP